MTLEDLAYRICTALDEVRHHVVLSGGSAATVYAPEAYQSKDLDFVSVSYSSLRNPPLAPLEQIGVKAIKNQMYQHPESPCTVEFLPGPLMVGSEQITQFDTLQRGEMKLHILTPTDCIRDRLAWHVAYRDVSAVQQAARVALAIEGRVEFEAIRDWCAREDSALTFRLLLAQMKALR